LGTNSDWAEFFTADHMAYLRKTDGSAWRFELYPYPQLGKTTVPAPKLNLERQTDLETPGWRNTSTIQVWEGLAHLGLDPDGSLRILVLERWNSHKGGMDSTKVDLPLGRGTNWVSLAGKRRTIVALKHDGSLWLWDFSALNHRFYERWDSDQILREMQNTVPVRLGTHSDWVAIGNLLDGVVALAADGSLWFWQPNPDTGRLLAASRKPALLGNIFGKTD
jgi:hypothetical protein